MNDGIDSEYGYYGSFPHCDSHQFLGLKNTCWCLFKGLKIGIFTWAIRSFLLDFIGVLGKKKVFFLEGISRGFGMKVGMVYCNMLCFEDDYWIGGSQTKKATESAPSPIHVFFVWGLWLDMLLFGEYLKNMRLKTMTWRPVSSNVAGWGRKKKHTWKFMARTIIEPNDIHCHVWLPVGTSWGFHFCMQYWWNISVKYRCIDRCIS